MDNNRIEMKEKEYSIDLINFFRDLWNGTKKLAWLLLLLAVLSAGIVSFYNYRSFKPYYTAYASFSVNLKAASDGSIYEDNLRASQLSKIFPYIIYSGVLRNIIYEDLGAGQLSETITAENVTGTNLFTIRVKSDDAQKAYDVLQSVIKNYPKVAETVVGSTNLAMLDESGIPDKPANSINFWGSVKIGAFAGIILEALILLLYALNRRTIHRIEDVVKVSNMKQLGVLPAVVYKKRRKKKHEVISLANESLPAAYKENLYKIRTRIEKLTAGKNLKSILVTSAMPAEGKSTFALNLALALAEEGKEVVLADCDLRRPVLKDMLSLPEDFSGLDSVLQGNAELGDALRYLEEYRISVLPCFEPLQSSPEMLGAPEMKEVLDTLSDTFDYVILDTVPSAMLSDTSELAKIADGAIYIIKQDYSDRNQILDGLEHLSESSGIEIIGCVLNHVKAGFSRYGYGYGYYGYGNRQHKEQFQIKAEG